ncbi:MAG: NAD(P)H-hydrate dehydratase [Urechidicola sp.]|nr:NAD(P)H-hydrate dehydratase [Urechidicola sp.]
MKILTAHQMYLADEATLKSEGITSLELMERTATLCFSWILNKFTNTSKKMYVFCGVGNNGGDGLVIARLLHQNGYNVHCFVVNFAKKRSAEFLTNCDRLIESGVSVSLIDKEEDFPVIDSDDVVIDAIFGIGLKRIVESFTSKLICAINNSDAYILSIDMPSGLFSDSSNSTTVVNATHTLTFQNPKTAFFLPENEKHINSWELIDIGLDANFIKTLESKSKMIDERLAITLYKSRSKFSHKGSFGHSLIIGGSYGKIGAVTLASKAALKSGSGLVTAYIPKCGYEIVQTSIPEVMVEVDAEKQLEYFNYKSRPTVIGVGPGMGSSEKTIQGFSKFLQENKLPLVVDADGLNILSKQKELLRLLPVDTILTPHPKEFERLVGAWENDIQKIALLKEFSAKYKVIVVLKGAHTNIVKNEKLYFNSTGNPALATAGSGDVLLGIITGLVAQNYSQLDAAILGVYLHGLTADLALSKTSIESFTASEIIENIGMAFMKIKK